MGDAWRRVKGTIYTNGYRVVKIRRHGQPRRFLAHQLVLTVFVGPCPPGMECRHRNGIRDDNRLENLCWGTRAENGADTARHGTLTGTRNPAAKLTDETVRTARRWMDLGVSDCEIGRRLGVSHAAIWNIRTGRRWTHVA
jgi:hypothetical protein